MKLKSSIKPSSSSSSILLLIQLSIFLFLNCILIPSSSLCNAVLSVTLESEEEHCFAFRTPGDEDCRIAGTYDIITNDESLSSTPVSVVLFESDTNNVVWHSKYGASSGEFHIVNHGRFHLCFGNGSGGYETKEDKEKELLRLQGHPDVADDDYDYESDGESRKIGFSLRVSPMPHTEVDKKQREQSESAEDKGNQQTEKILNLADQLEERMESLLDHQEYIKNREADHRHIVESTFTMVMRWTVLEALILISIAAMQVYYLKRFFETKRYL